ncbi:hypothetical protein H5410_031403 [Solanum commersonii]|uniref:Reverse transcriptase domain-containing protein n=1 Tax=Solanum commersonii TaxID=4109 RepID=A0A9J5YIA6_SOLCO|nr:hypothetical protein H5410_031403 [Solanum commersonii]
MLFADDIVLIDKSRDSIKRYVEGLETNLESKGFGLRTKTKYLKCKFTNVTHMANVEVRIDT